jgi:hypothetical protein
MSHAYQSCLSNDDDDWMMVRDCLCRVDKDEKSKNEWCKRGVSNLTVVLIYLIEMFQNQINHSLLYRFYLSYYREMAQADAKDE